MKLNVLTAVSRPENLSAIAASLAEAIRRAPGVDVSWHLRFDLKREHVGGQRLKNQMLNDIHDGWVWILDDDTLVYKRFFEIVGPVANARPELTAIVVSQRRTSGHVLQARPENVVVGSIDVGQVLLRREFIYYARIPETYAGDGEWLEGLLRGNQDVAFVRDVLSLHNVLSGVEVSE